MLGVYAVPNVPGRVFAGRQMDGSVRIKKPEGFAHEELVFGVARIVGARIDFPTKDWIVPPERVELFELVMERICV
ncbi:hypothetical protein [Hydrogenophaga sp.]|uniref:hypothetical protein n=1 Tax=Hydrogenophaga sp. TaxID=1904254 RepID=UPI002C29342B|nr:hypothetical protein [Hydrogenophaga sp.]HMP09505.1 hypothetical protein [Hydrogenophaga sp.]